MNSNEVSALLTALDDLIEIKVLIRKAVPQYNLDENLNSEFITKLNSLNNKLKPIFAKYLVEVSSDVQSENLKDILIEQLSKSFALISSNSSKKKLKSIGIDPRRLIVSGGPIYYEDYKLINPNLTEKTLENIKSKCERILNQIRSESWINQDLIFIYEKENPTDKLILKRIEDLKDIIGKEVKTIEISNWKDLDV